METLPTEHKITKLLSFSKGNKVLIEQISSALTWVANQHKLQMKSLQKK